MKAQMNKDALLKLNLRMFRANPSLTSAAWDNLISKTLKTESVTQTLRA
jgi:hypothetical protein